MNFRKYPGSRLRSSFMLALVAGIALAASASSVHAARMIGYWEAWGDLPLASVSPNYDVVMISFGSGSGVDNATMTFSGGTEPNDNLIADVRTLQARGVKVLMSLGGGGGPHTELLNNKDREEFVHSIEGIVDKFHVDGIDLDFEDGIFAVDQGDNDLDHPTTPNIVNMIAAMHELHDHYGSRFMITAPPESEAMNGYGFFGNKWGRDWTGAYGGFLSFLNGCRDVISFVAPQYYNAASYDGLDNVTYNPGDPDFDVSQVDILLHGYTLITGQYFAPLRPSQVAMGIMADNEGDGSYFPPKRALQVAEYIGSGVSFGGKYPLASADGYPDFGGVMTWDINIDEGQNYILAKRLAPYLHSLPDNATTITDRFGALDMTGSDFAAQVGGDIASGSAQSSGGSNALTYHCGSIVSFRANITSVLDRLSFFASANGSNWSPVEVTDGAPLADGSCNIIPAGALPPGTNFVRLTTPVGTGEANSIMLHRVSITYLGQPPSNSPAPGSPSALAAVAADGRISLSWQGATGATSYTIYRGDSAANEAPIPVASGLPSTWYVDTGLTSGTRYYYKVVATGPGGTSASPDVSAVFAREMPFGQATAVPGVVRAVDYDRGGDGIAYHIESTLSRPGLGGVAKNESVSKPDLTSAYRADDAQIRTCSDPGPARGRAVGPIGSGDWLNYTIDAEASGAYQVVLGVASTQGGTLRLRAANAISLGSAIVVPPRRGPDNWTKVTGSVTLAGGKQIIQIYDNAGSVSLEYVKFNAQAPTAPTNVQASGNRNSVMLTWLPSTSGAMKYNVYRGTATGSEASVPIASNIVVTVAKTSAVFIDKSAAIGKSYYYIVKAVNTAGTSVASTEAHVKLGRPGPYGGVARSIPGVVNFDDYDEGGQGAGYFVNNATSNQGHAYRTDYVGIQPCTDANKIGNGYNVGWTNSGNWLAFAVDVKASGAYMVTFRVAAHDGGGQIHLQDSTGNNISGEVTLPKTGGWQSWASVTVPVTLKAGKQELYLYEDSDAVNLEYMSIH